MSDHDTPEVGSGQTAPTYAEGIALAAEMAALYDTGEQAARALRVTAEMVAGVAASSAPASPVPVQPSDAGEGLSEDERAKVRSATNMLNTGGYPAMYRCVERILAARDAEHADRLAAVEAERGEAERLRALWFGENSQAQAALATALREKANVEAVLGAYFDFDADPWEDHDAACPAPEDIWRLHRDLRAALAKPTTTGDQGADQ